MRRAPRQVWFLVAPRTGLLNIAGPWEVLGHANEVLGRDAYQLELVGPTAPAAQTRHGLVIGGIRPLPRSIPRPPHVAIVAGGSPLVPMPEEHARLAAWLRRHHAGIRTIVSICTGAYVLGEAGLLDGRRATTHWLRLDDLRSRFPAAQIVDEGIF